MEATELDVQWFLDACGTRRDEHEADPETVRQALWELLGDVAAAWPDLPACDQSFLSHLAGHVSAEGDVLDALARIRAADLFLAHRCACGDAAALHIIESDYIRSVRSTVLSMRAAGDVADEVTQRVRERLFVGTQDRQPRIADYSGRGDLRSWLRAVAGRTYLNTLRSQGREVSVGDAALLDAVSSDTVDPELAHMKERYRMAFRRAFTDALESLPAKRKNLLRYRYVDELDIAALAKLYKVHRATLHRWLADAREALAHATEAMLRARLAISEAEFDSIRRLVVSQLEVSLRRALGGPS